MHVAVTGATGFLGRYVVNHLLRGGHSCRCWYRRGGDRTGFVPAGDRLEWIEGRLGDRDAARTLVKGAGAVVHAALHHPGGGFRGGEGDLEEFVRANVVGSIQLILAASEAGAERFIFISTCAVHEIILDDRPLDEAHPLWPTSHYGAHKAAIEKFIHGFGFGEGYNVCALRPTGIYGLARPVENSRWYGLVKAVQAGRPIRTARGGKEVHAADVARAVEVLLTAEGTTGQAYNCYDMYVAEQDVAKIAKEVTGSGSRIAELNKGPKYQIDTSKLRALGMTFGGRELLERTVTQLVEA